MNSTAPNKSDAGHSAAAERIGAYLSQRKIVLSPADHLELAAQILDQNSVNTRIEPSTLVSQDEMQEAHACRLALFYSPINGGTDEHPVYSEDEWQIDGNGADSRLSYWRWVANTIEVDQAMWPWDREADVAVLASRGAGISIEYIGGRGWTATGPGALLIEHRACQAELQAWRAAAEAVMALPVVRGQQTHGEIRTLPVTLLTYFISTRLAPALALLQSADNSFVSIKGRMKAFERTHCIWVRFARVAGVGVTGSRDGSWALENAPLIQEIDASAGYATEAAAWRAAAQGLVLNLRRSLGIAGERWNSKAPAQQLELLQTFFSDVLPPNPEATLDKHLAYCAKTLCRSIGWKVQVRKPEDGVSNPVWSLNQDSVEHITEASAWHSGANAIREKVMALCGLSYIAWAGLPLDGQIILAQQSLL